MGARADESARGERSRPSFADVAPGNAFYAPSALAVSAGAMAADATGRFEPTRPATGAEVLAALARIAAVGDTLRTPWTC